MEGEVSAWQGKSLCRSGEELGVEKAIDRFTLALPPGDCLAQLGAEWGAALNAEVLQTLPALGLVECRVASERLDSAMQSARTGQGVRFVSHVYEMNCSPGTPIYLTNQITVQFAEATDAQTMRTIAHSLGLQVVKLIPSVAKAFVFEVTPQATANPLKLAHQLMGYPQVLMAEPNVAVPIQHYPASQNGEHNEPLLSQLLSQQEATTPIGAITQGDRSIVVAIAEEAIDWQHPGFRGMGKIVAPMEFGGNPKDTKTQRGIQKETQKDSKALIQNPNSKIQNLIEVAPDCALMPIAIGKWLDDQLVEQICQWAIEQGAAVLVCNWGADAAYFPLSLRQRVALSRAATQGRDGKGCVVVFAAGNADRPAAEIAEQAKVNLSQGATQWLNGFAVHPDVITVAACTNHSRATHSNWGTSIAVCAEAVSEKRDRGTGAASAIGAGTAALMLSVNPDLTARQVRRMLQDTADRIVDPELQSGSQAGWYDALGHSPWFGYGQINTLKAVKAAWQSMKPVEIADRWLEGQNTRSLDIPDGDWRGVCSAIDLEDSGLIKSIEISLEIEHSLMGDLEIYLISPKSEVILLQNRTLGRITLLRKTYNFETTPLLKVLLNHAVAGQWQLQVIDRVVLNTGQLQQWQLRVGVGK